MVGRRNENGVLLQCSHCGYSWYYQGDKSVTSCPNDGWRVRVRASSRGEVANPATESGNREKRYY